VKAVFATQHGAEHPGVSFGPSSLFEDAAGRLWFGGGFSQSGAPAPLAGYLKPATGEIVFLPALEDPVTYDASGHPYRRSLTLHPASNGQDIWGTDYYGGKLYLLKKLPN
jgi:hypothetical protein